MDLAVEVSPSNMGDHPDHPVHKRQGLNVKLTFSLLLNTLHYDFCQWWDEKNSCYVMTTVACGLSNEKRKDSESEFRTVTSFSTFFKAENDSFNATKACARQPGERVGKEKGGTVRT